MGKSPSAATYSKIMWLDRSSDETNFEKLLDPSFPPGDIRENINFESFWKRSNNWKTK